MDVCFYAVDVTCYSLFLMTVVCDVCSHTDL